ncbi:hypothetical protein RYX36_017528 [Vicia faba]
MGIKRLGSLDDFMPKLGVFAAFSGDDDFGSEIGSCSKSESGIRIGGGRSGMSDWLRNGREGLPVKLKTKRGNRTGKLAEMEALAVVPVAALCVQEG